MILFFLILMCLSGSARDVGTSWVVTDEGKINCKKIVMGYDNARIIFDNGQRSSISISRVSSFSMNGKVYTKLPLYKDGKATGKVVFMELIKTCGDLCLYKYGMCKPETPDPKMKVYCYFLYNGTKLYKALDEETLANIDRNFKRYCSFDY
jgi:hypothetical protein